MPEPLAPKGSLSGTHWHTKSSLEWHPPRWRPPPPPAAAASCACSRAATCMHAAGRGRLRRAGSQAAAPHNLLQQRGAAWLHGCRAVVLQGSSGCCRLLCSTEGSAACLPAASTCTSPANTCTVYCLHFCAMYCCCTGAVLLSPCPAPAPAPPARQRSTGCWPSLQYRGGGGAVQGGSTGGAVQGQHKGSGQWGRGVPRKCWRRRAGRAGGDWQCAASNPACGDGAWLDVQDGE